MNKICRIYLHLFIQFVKKKMFPCRVVQEMNKCDRCIWIRECLRGLCWDCVRHDENYMIIKHFHYQEGKFQMFHVACIPWKVQVPRYTFGLQLVQRQKFYENLLSINSWSELDTESESSVSFPFSWMLWDTFSSVVKYEKWIFIVKFASWYLFNRLRRWCEYDETSEM